MTLTRFDRALASLEAGYDIEADGSSYTPTPLVIDKVG